MKALGVGALLLTAAACTGGPSPTPPPAARAPSATPSPILPAAEGGPDAASAAEFVRAYVAAARARNCERLADMSDVDAAGRRAADATPEQLQRLAPEAARVMRDMATDARATLVRLCSQGAMDEWRILGDSDLVALTTSRADGVSADLTMYLRSQGQIQKRDIHLLRRGDGSWEVDLEALDF